ncbi:MAG: hypothetical protein IJX47_06195 [Clostridia bacterium]|nr:hypothetical protein [Clostridia bacterium]
MMIYNTVDYPIAIELGGNTYYMDRDSELELRLTSGTYDYRLYKADEGDEPLPSHLDRRGYRRYDVTVCYAETGKLTCKRGTRLYIREDYIELFKIRLRWRSRGYGQYRIYNASAFNLTVEDGELAERRQGCLNERVYNKMLAPYKAWLWIQGATHVAFLVLAALFGLGVFELHHTVNYAAIACTLVGQLALIDEDVQKIHLIRALKSVPVLVDVQDFLEH